MGWLGIELVEHRARWDWVLEEWECTTICCQPAKAGEGERWARCVSVVESVSLVSLWGWLVVLPWYPWT